MLPLNDALTKMLEQLPLPTKSETLPLNLADERICAEDVVSPINVPAFDNSAMDGYAVRFADLEKSMTLPLAGKSFAGVPFTGEWPEGSVIRIMTGAMLPQGADAVIMQEQTTQNPDGSITFEKMPKMGSNIRRIGEDVKKGDVVLAKGAKLTALSLPLLASLGLEKVQVFPKVKVALLSTGDELVSVGNPLKEGQIYDTNRFSVSLMLKRLGCEILDLGILADDPAVFEKAFQEAQEQADLIITSGGVSVGEADFTKNVLEKLGHVNFWKIAMKPGKPFAFGKIGQAWFCGLPGNPVSALVTFYQLVQPALARLNGYTQWKAPASLPAVAGNFMKKRTGRLDFQRGFYFVNAQGQLEVNTVGFQGSHMFSSFIASNCFIVLEQDRANVEAGEIVTIQPFNAILG